MKCQNCGEEFNGSVCPKCGTQAQEPEQATQAPIEQQPISL